MMIVNILCNEHINDILYTHNLFHTCHIFYGKVEVDSRPFCKYFFHWLPSSNCQLKWCKCGKDNTGFFEPTIQSSLILVWNQLVVNFLISIPTPH